MTKAARSLAGLLLAAGLSGIALATPSLQHKTDYRRNLEGEINYLMQHPEEYKSGINGCNTRALRYSEKGDFATAEKIIDLCIEKFSGQNERLYLHQSVICLQNNKYEKSKAAAKKFLEETYYYNADSENEERLQKITLATAYHILAYIEYEEGTMENNKEKLKTALHYYIAQYLLAPKEETPEAIVEMKTKLKLQEKDLAVEIIMAKETIKKKMPRFEPELTISEMIRTIVSYSNQETPMEE